MLAKLTESALFARSQVRELINGPTMIEASHPMLAAARYPGDLCCDIYSHKNYGGDKKRLCLSGDLSPAIHELDNYGWENEMNSWSCGKNVFAHFCNDDFFMCSEENG